MSNQVDLKTRDIIQAVSSLLGVQSVAEQQKLTVAIGAHFAQLRKDKGITQGELAKMLGISQPMVSDYERGELRLHGELIVQLTAILNISADELLGLSQQSSKPSAIKNRRLYRRIEAIDKLPKRDQEALLRTIDAFTAKAS